MPLEYSFWDGREFVVYGALAKGRWLIPEFVRTLRGQGKTVHVVDTRGGTLKGEPVAVSLDALDSTPEAALLVIEPASAEAAIADLADHGVKRVWIDTRGDSGAAARLAREHGLEVIEERCPLLTMPGALGVHRLHATILRAFGRLPRP